MNVVRLSVSYDYEQIDICRISQGTVTPIRSSGQLFHHFVVKIQRSVMLLT